MSKYPYVADKKMYAAMMFACKMIRENGWFNKAIYTAANWYKVDKDKLEKVVRERQSAGQKAKAKPRKYKWFTCVVLHSIDGGLFVKNPHIKKGLSKDNVEKMIDSYYSDGSYFHEDFIHVLKEYKNQKEAQENLNSDYEEYHEKQAWILSN